jgi:hypothetical protein
MNAAGSARNLLRPTAPLAEGLAVPVNRAEGLAVPVNRVVALLAGAKRTRRVAGPCDAFAKGVRPTARKAASLAVWDALLEE